VRVEITVVSVVITFMRVKSTIRLEIALCVYKSQNYSRVSGNHNFACNITLVRFEITLVRVGITFVTVEITLRVEITLCV
jgi:hypothetical protein